MREAAAVFCVCTFELAIPISRLGANPGAAGLWSFQVRATARDYHSSTTLYFNPQADRRLLPERYGLLKIPAPKVPQP